MYAGRDLNAIKLFQGLSDAQKYALKKRVTIANYVKGNLCICV
jgi:hypothetical protein